MNLSGSRMFKDVEGPRKAYSMHHLYRSRQTSQIRSTCSVCTMFPPEIRSTTCIAESNEAIFAGAGTARQSLDIFFVDSSSKRA